MDTFRIPQLKEFRGQMIKHYLYGRSPEELESCKKIIEELEKKYDKH
jgi:hypothetical protein